MDKNPQDSAAWIQSRVGKVTASNLWKVVRRQKNGKTYAAHDDYLAQLVMERLTGRAADNYVSEAMEIGTMREDGAALHYAMETGADVQFSDFVNHPTIEGCGASPDRLVDDMGLIEIKCPQPKAHFDFLMTDEIPENYWWQMQWQMACTERQWCDFMSYSPEFDARPALVAKIKRVERDDEAIMQAENLAMLFIEEVKARVEKLEQIAAQGGA